MLVLATTNVLHRLREAIPQQVKLTVAKSAHDAVTTLDSQQVSGFVLEPSVIAEEAIESILRALQRTCAQLLLYAPLNGLVAQRVLQVATRRQCELVLCDTEGERRALRHWVGSPLEPTLSSLLLTGIAKKLALLPLDAQPAFVRLFSDRAAANSVGCFSPSLQVNARTVERWCDAATLRSPRHIIAAALIARSWPLPSRGSGLALEAWAAQSGFGTLKRMERHYHYLVGVSPAHARRYLTTHHVGQRLIRSIDALTPIRRTPRSVVVP